MSVTLSNTSLTRDTLILSFADLYTTHSNPDGTREEGCFTYGPSDKGPHNISECHCVPWMNRSHRQYFIEEPLLEKVEQVFSKNKPLIIYSLGSGGCYQELSICVQLAKLGYSVQKIVLVDTNYDTLENDQRIIDFKKIFSTLFSQVAEVSVYRTEENYRNALENLKEKKPNIILCIDIERECLSYRHKNWEKMLGDHPDDPCVFVYYNIKHQDEGVENVIDAI